MEISLCMIVKNEEENLQRCLESAHNLADEIIIVDTGSVDKTKDIASCYTDKIYDFKWINDFSAARNFSFSKAAKDYIMWLDADDIITEENQKKILELKESLTTKTEVVLMPYEYIVTDDGKILQTLIRERIVKRSSGFLWEGEIHETINFMNYTSKENVMQSQAAVTHTKKLDDSEGSNKSDRNLLILESVVKKGGASLRMVFYYACELKDHNRMGEAAAHFEDMFAKGGYATPYCLDACIELYDLYIKRNECNKAFELCKNCVPYCGDRSEFCCLFGDFYNNIANDVNEALKWYTAALTCPIDSDKFMSNREYYYYCIPYLRLGEIYKNLGQNEKSMEYLKKALRYKKKEK